MGGEDYSEFLICIGTSLGVSEVGYRWTGIFLGAKKRSGGGEGA